MGRTLDGRTHDEQPVRATSKQLAIPERRALVERWEAEASHFAILPIDVSVVAEPSTQDSK
jgi:hypothetical protein